MRRRFTALALAGVLLSACTAQPAPSPSLARPSSPAVITIVQPVAGETVSGTTVHVVLSLEGAKIVSQTTTDIRPDHAPFNPRVWSSETIFTVE